MNANIKTFPEMNKIIVDLLRQSGEAKQLYAAARIEELERQVSRLEAALKAWEEWEADLIMCNDAWRGSLPTLPQELLDRMIELQEMRNDTLEVRGNAQD